MKGIAGVIGIGSGSIGGLIGLAAMLGDEGQVELLKEVKNMKPQMFAKAVKEANDLAYDHFSEEIIKEDYFIIKETEFHRVTDFQSVMDRMKEKFIVVTINISGYGPSWFVAKDRAGFEKGIAALDKAIESTRETLDALEKERAVLGVELGRIV